MPKGPVTSRGRAKHVIGVVVVPDVPLELTVTQAVFGPPMPPFAKIMGHPWTLAEVDTLIRQAFWSRSRTWTSTASTSTIRRCTPPAARLRRFAQRNFEKSVGTTAGAYRRAFKNAG